MHDGHAGILVQIAVADFAVSQVDDAERRDLDAAVGSRASVIAVPAGTQFHIALDPDAQRRLAAFYFGEKQFDPRAQKKPVDGGCPPEERESGKPALPAGENEQAGSTIRIFTRQSVYWRTKKAISDEHLQARLFGAPP